MPDEPKKPTPPKYFSWCGPDMLDSRYNVVGVCMSRDTAAMLRCSALKDDPEALSVQVDLTDHLKYIAQRSPGKGTRLLLVITDSFDALKEESMQNAQDPEVAFATATKPVLH